MKKYLSRFIFFVLLILLFTHGVFNNYFQQDEWGAFGTVMYLSLRPVWEWFGTNGGVHFVPFARFFLYLLYKVFGLQAQYYVFVQLAIHIGTTFLIYLFAYKLTKNERVGLLSAIFFATNYRAAQGFSHIALLYATTTSTFFIVLFFTYLVFRISEQYFKTRDMIFLFVTFYAAIFFREDGLIIAPLFLVFLYLFDRKKFNRRNRRFLITFYLSFICIFFLRVVLQYFNPSQYVPSKISFLHAFIYNFFTLPIKFIVQNLIGGSGIFLFLLGHNGYIYANNSVNFLASYPVFMDFVFLIIFNVIVGATVLIRNKYTQRKETNRYILFSLSWIVIDAALLSLIGRQLYIVEEHYLYLPSVGVFFLLSYLLVRLYASDSKSSRISAIKKGFVIAFVGIYLIISYREIQSIMKRQEFYGTARRSILSSLRALYPTIPKDTTFYVRCKITCYRNHEFNVSEEYVLPFTLGSGYVILAQYTLGNENHYGAFFNAKVGTDRPFLGDLGSQGYKKIGDYGFGYFYDQSELKKVIQEERLDTNIVIGLEYNEDDFSLRDISTEVRQEIGEK